MKPIVQVFLFTFLLATMGSFLVVGVLTSPFLLLFGVFGAAGYVIGFDVVVALFVGLFIGVLGAALFALFSALPRVIQVIVALVILAVGLATFQPEIDVLAIVPLAFAFIERNPALMKK